MNPRARRLRKHNRRNHKCEVLNLSKEILNALNQPHNLHHEDDYFDQDNPWVQRLINLGFVIITSAAGKELLIHPIKSLVVKVMYRIGINCIPTDRAPTLFIRNIHSSDHRSYDIVVQNLVDISRLSQSKAFGFIYKMNKLERNKKFGIDTHEGNVGIYNNKVVVFDW
jgi:hypothetical protein